MGLPTLKRIGGVLDSKAKKMRLDYCRQKKVYLICSEYALLLGLKSTIDGEDCTYDSKEDDSSSYCDQKAADDDVEELVLKIKRRRMVKKWLRMMN